MINYIYSVPLYKKSVSFNTFENKGELMDFYYDKMLEIFYDSNTNRYNTRDAYFELSDAYEYMTCKK